MNKNIVVIVILCVLMSGFSTYSGVSYYKNKINDELIAEKNSRIIELEQNLIDPINIDNSIDNTWEDNYLNLFYSTQETISDLENDVERLERKYNRARNSWGGSSTLILPQGGGVS